MPSSDLKSCLLIAHQDDELFCLDLLEIYQPTLVIYLTDGVATHKINHKFSSVLRRQESENFLRSLPFNCKVVQFGIQNALSDGRLHSQFCLSHYLSLAKIIKSHEIDILLTSHLEGGNHDHDLVFIISRMLGELYGLTRITFPTYRSYRNLPSLFRVMNLKSEGTLLEPCVLPRLILLRHLKNGFASYRSQRKTWLGLGIFVTARYLKPNKLRRAINAIESKNPYGEKALFEIRKRARVSEVTEKMNEIIKWNIKASQVNIHE